MQIWFLKIEHFPALALLCCIAFLCSRLCPGGCSRCTRWGVTVSIFSQLGVLFYLWIYPEIVHLSIDNLIVALQHQPLIYYSLEATQKESFNLFPSAPKNGELTQVQ